MVFLAYGAGSPWATEDGFWVLAAKYRARMDLPIVKIEGMRFGEKKVVWVCGNQRTDKHKNPPTQENAPAGLEDGLAQLGGKVVGVDVNVNAGHAVIGHVRVPGEIADAPPNIIGVLGTLLEHAGTHRIGLTARTVPRGGPGLGIDLLDLEKKEN